MGLTKTAIETIAAASAGNTFLDNAQFFYIDQSLGSGAGPYEINTGIIPALTPNTYIIVRAESALAIGSVNQDSGHYYWQLGWGAPGVLPFQPTQVGVSGTAPILSAQFNSWQLNASGELVLRLNDAAPNEMWAAFKIAVWIKVLPFAPTFVS